MILNQLLLKRNKKNYRGGIDFVSTSIISGWLYNPKTNYQEIRITLGPHLIASTQVNIYREDVSAALNKEGNFGFCFELDNIEKNYEQYSQSYTPKLIAINSDLTSKIEVQSINKKFNSDEAINILFKENLIGLDGHVDGYSLSNDSIIGWAGDKITQNVISIWMISKDKKLKMPIKCDSYRGEKDIIGMINECGFLLDIKELDKAWFNNSVNFFFDEKGIFPIPGETEIRIYEPQKYQNTINNLQVINHDKDLNYLIKAGNSSEELRYKWVKLNQNKVFLDLIDKRLFENQNSNKFKLLINKLNLFKSTK